MEQRLQSHGRPVDAERRGQAGLPQNRYEDNCCVNVKKLERWRAMSAETIQGHVATAMDQSRHWAVVSERKRKV